MAEFFSETDSRSGLQKKFYEIRYRYHIHRAVPILCKMKLLHNLTPHFVKIHLNNILPSTPMSQKCN
jgi:hypothetical protein